MSLSPKQVERLLDDLCAELGFCLPPDVYISFQNEPPNEIVAFAEAVIRAEGLDPEADISRHLFRAVAATVRSHFRAAEDSAP